MTITATEVQNIPDKEDMPLSQTERQLTATMAQMADGLAVNAAASDCYSEYEQTYVWPWHPAAVLGGALLTKINF